MPRIPFRLNMRILEVACIDEADGPGDAEPYVWPAFFKIDGESFAVGYPALGLVGLPKVIPTIGRHGNLNDVDVDAGDTVRVPVNVGSIDTVFSPIQVLDADTRAFLGPDLPGIAGIVVILMEEDLWHDPWPIVGYNAFLDAIQLGLARVVAGFQHNLMVPTKAEIEAKIGEVKTLAETYIHAAIKNKMSAGDMAYFGTAGNNDDRVAVGVWFVNQDDFKGTNEIQAYKHWNNSQTNGNGHWGIKVKFTNLDGAPIPIDPQVCTDLAAEIDALEEDLAGATDPLERKRIFNALAAKRERSRQLGCPRS